MNYQLKYQALRQLLLTHRFIHHTYVEATPFNNIDALTAGFSNEATRIEQQLAIRAITSKNAFLKLLSTVYKYVPDNMIALRAASELTGRPVVLNERLSFLADVVKGAQGQISPTEFLVQPIEATYAFLSVEANNLLSAQELRDANLVPQEDHIPGSIPLAVKNFQMALYAKSRAQTTPRNVVEQCDKILVRSLHSDKTDDEIRSLCAPISIHDYLFHRMTSEDVSLFDLLKDLRDNRVTPRVETLLTDGSHVISLPEANGNQAIIEYMRRFIGAANTLSQSENFVLFKAHLTALINNMTELDRTVRSLQIDKDVLENARTAADSRTHYQAYANRSLERRCRTIDDLVTNINTNLRELDRAPANNKFQTVEIVAIAAIVVSLLVLLAASIVCAPFLPVAAAVAATLGAAAPVAMGIAGGSIGLTGMIGGIALGFFGRKQNPLHLATQDMIRYGTQRKEEAARIINPDNNAPRHR